MTSARSVEPASEGGTKHKPLARRSILRGAAWSIPVIAAATALPLATASGRRRRYTVKVAGTSTGGKATCTMSLPAGVNNITYTVVGGQGGAGASYGGGKAASLAGTIAPLITATVIEIIGAGGGKNGRNDYPLNNPPANVDAQGGEGYGNGGTAPSVGVGRNSSNNNPNHESWKTGVSGGGGGGGGSAILINGSPAVVAAGGGGGAGSVGRGWHSGSLVGDHSFGGDAGLPGGAGAAGGSSTLNEGSATLTSTGGNGASGASAGSGGGATAGGSWTPGDPVATIGNPGTVASGATGGHGGDGVFSTASGNPTGNPHNPVTVESSSGGGGGGYAGGGSGGTAAGFATSGNGSARTASGAGGGGSSYVDTALATPSGSGALVGEWTSRGPFFAPAGYVELVFEGPAGLENQLGCLVSAIDI